LSVVWFSMKKMTAFWIGLATAFAIALATLSTRG